MRRIITDIKGWAGHVLDLVRAIRLNFKNPHNYTKFKIIQSLKRKSRSKVFIEAGTYLGVTADRCSRIFDQVYTIELNQTLARRAADFLKLRKNVTVIKGDALTILPQLLQRSEIDKAFIYLDGHVCDSMSSAGDIPEPAVEELTALLPYQDKINVVVVDDFRNFGVEKNFPSKSVLLKTAEENFPSSYFDILIHWDQLVILRTNQFVTDANEKPQSVH